MASVAEQIDLSGGFQKARQEVRGELEDVAQEGEDEMLRVIGLRDAVATGDLKASIQTHVTSRTGSLRAVVGADAKPGSNVAPHAHFADQPTRPAFPPVKAVTGKTEALDRWVRAKHGQTGEERTTTAFLVARSIARRGTPGVRFTDAGLREMKDGLTSRIESAFTRGLTDGNA